LRYSARRLLAVEAFGLILKGMSLAPDSVDQNLREERRSLRWTLVFDAFAVVVGSVLLIWGQPWGVTSLALLFMIAVPLSAVLDAVLRILAFRRKSKMRTE
jgi:hypothetical protein